MIGIMTTVEQLAGITAQHNEIVKRVSNGSLDPGAVKRALQNIIEGKFIDPIRNPPAWWRTPEQQLERARQLWPNAVLPESPEKFTPRTESEVLLLHVPDSFDSLWDKVIAPKGYTKYGEVGIRCDEQSLRLVPERHEFTEPVWLAFDPEHGKGESPESLWGQDNLAASEVLSALIHFPQWPTEWLFSASPPHLTGYQFKLHRDWSQVPSLELWGGDARLELSCFAASARSGGWASPSVRVL